MWSRMKLPLKFVLLSKVFLILLFLSAARAETYIVGDSYGWNAYTNYTNWTSGKSFHVGDSLVFKYEEGLHTVVQVNETAYETCVKQPNLGISGGGNDTITMPKVGRVWYVCGVSDHCENGQKLSIEVLP